MACVIVLTCNSSKSGGDMSAKGLYQHINQKHNRTHNPLWPIGIGFLSYEDCLNRAFEGDEIEIYKELRSFYECNCILKWK